MHAPPDGPLHAHSIAETFLFAQLTYCPHCRRRPVRPAERLRATGGGRDPWLLAVECAGCGRGTELRFLIDPPPRSPEQPDARINPTPARSDLIDLAGWVTLARGIIDGAQKTGQRDERRDLLLEAEQCLGEAMKFFEPGRDDPCDDAFFTEASRARAKEHPDAFSRSTIVALRSKLPTGARGPQIKPRRPWWKWW